MLRTLRPIPPSSDKLSSFSSVIWFVASFQAGNDVIVAEFTENGQAHITYNGGYTIPLEYFKEDSSISNGKKLELRLDQIKTECKFLGRMRYLLILTNSADAKVIDRIEIRNAEDLCRPNAVQLLLGPEGIILQVDGGKDGPKKWVLADREGKFIFMGK